MSAAPCARCPFLRASTPTSALSHMGKRAHSDAPLHCGERPHEPCAGAEQFRRHIGWRTGPRDPAVFADVTEYLAHHERMPEEIVSDAISEWPRPASPFLPLPYRNPA